MSRSRSRSRSRSPGSKFSRPPTPPPLPTRRFTRGDRVVCNIGDPYGWVSGAVNAVNEPDPQYAGEFLPYVVKLDPPISRPLCLSAFTFKQNRLRYNQISRLSC